LKLSSTSDEMTSLQNDMQPRVLALQDDCANKDRV